MTQYKRNGEVFREFGWSNTPVDGEYVGNDALGNAIYKDKNGKETVYKPDDVGGTPVNSSDGIANFIGWTLYYIASAFAKLLGILMYVLTHYVVVYNNFLNHNIVATGWAIVRDVCNNFFIIGLLIIAVATILQQPKGWEYKGTLGKLLIMAVLINFSKLATGVLIDISQVVMLFFAEPLRDFGGSLMLVAFGLYGMFQVAEQDPNTAIFGSWQAVVQVIYAMIASVIATVVIASVIMVLVYRIVTLWFLVILSPAAFLAYAVPGQQKHFSKWLSRLTSELIVGPVMIFFIYLSVFAGAINFQQPGDPSYSSAGGSAGNSQQIQPGLFNNTGDNSFSNAAPNNENPAATYGTWPEQFWSFLIIVGLLIGSLVAGQQVGATGSGFASKGKGIIDGWRNKGIGYAKKGGSMALSGAKDRVKSGLGVVGAGIKALDSAALGGTGAAVLNYAKRGVVQGVGVSGAAGTAAAVGAVFGGPAGALIAGGVAGAISTYLRSSKNLREKARQDRDAVRAAEATPDRGDWTDATGNRIAEADARTRMGQGEIVGRYSEQLGSYIQTRHDETGTEISLNDTVKGPDGQEISRRDVLRDGAGNEVSRYTLGSHRDANGAHSQTATEDGYTWDQARSRYVANNSASKLQVYRDQAGNERRFLDVNGTPTASMVPGGWYWNGSSYVQLSTTTTGKVRDDANKIVSRYGELKLDDGTYRRFSRDGQYVRVDNNGAAVNSAGAAIDDAGLRAGGQTVAAMVATMAGNRVARGQTGQFMRNLMDSWDGSSNKGVMVAQAAEQEAIMKLTKDHEGKSKELLQEQFLMERDDKKRQALAMTLAIKEGFRNTEMVNMAKQVLRSNALLTKEFNAKMNKKNVIANNTRADGSLDEANIERLFAKGEFNWADQDLKQMNASAFALMARTRGAKFAGDVDNMIKTSADKSRISQILGTNIGTRQFVGPDLALRQVYGATSGNWQQAFQDGAGTLNQRELGKAIQRIPKPSVFGSVGADHFADNPGTHQFKIALAGNLQYNQYRRMVQSDDINPEQLTNYIKTLKQVAGVGRNRLTDANNQPIVVSPTVAAHAAAVLAEIRTNPATRATYAYWPD